MKKFQFAVILTEEKKTVLLIDNLGIYKSIAAWQKRFASTNSLVLFSSETDSLDINLSHHFLS